MIGNTLQDIADHLAVEKAQGKLQQLDQKIGDQRYIDARADMEQDPAADELHRRLAQKQHQLGDQYQVDKTNVLVADADIDDRLGKKRENQLQQAAQGHPQQQLVEEALMGS